MPRALLTLVASFAGAALLVGTAHAHAPTTGIGRAVAAFEDVPVSYDPASPLTELDAEAPLRSGAGNRLHVALLAASATQELPGTPDEVAAEIAREAALTGTLIVLVGTRFGAWNDEIGRERLDELIVGASGGRRSPAVELGEVVRAVAAEPKDDSGLPWSWVVVTTVGVLAGLVFLARRTRPPAGPG